MRPSPSSKLIEFTMQRPADLFRPASSTGDSVLSSISGAFTCRTTRETNSAMSVTPLRPTKSTHTSRRWLPSFISSRAMPTSWSHCSSSSKRLNLRLPLALVRSATIKNELSCLNSVMLYKLLHAGACAVVMRGVRARDSPRTLRTS